MRVLVTGGAGYVGTELVAALCDRQEVGAVTVYDNLARGSHSFFLQSERFSKPVRFIRGDVLDSISLRRAVDSADTVVHLAAVVTTPFTHADAVTMDQVNHWGTAELSYALERVTGRRVVYASSLAVYGHSDLIASAGAPTAPATAYGRSKLAGEAMLSRLSEEHEVRIARLANVYGYGRSMRFDAVVNRMALDAALFGRVTIEGGGEQVRTLVEVRRAAAVLAELSCGGAVESPLSVGDHALSVNEIAEGLAAIQPGLERLEVLTSLPVRSLRVERDPRVDSLPCRPASSFHEDLGELFSQLLICTPTSTPGSGAASRR